MNISFDPLNPDECEKVLAMVWPAHWIAAEAAPVAEAAPAAPAAEAAAEAAPAAEAAAEAAPALDAKGTPWLVDHHAATKTTKKDGTWTRRRGGDADAAEAAEAAARGQAAPQMPTAPVMPSVEADPLPQPVSYPQMVGVFTEASKLPTFPGVDSIYATAGVQKDAMGAWDTAAFATNETLRAAVVDACKTLIDANG